MLECCLLCIRMCVGVSNTNIMRMGVLFENICVYVVFVVKTRGYKVTVLTKVYMCVRPETKAQREKLS